MQVLVLKKGGEVYLFRYNEGGEDQLVAELKRMATSDVGPIDWLDVAKLCLQMAQKTLEKK